MKFLKRSLYFFYYLKEADFQQLNRFFRYSRLKSKKSGITIIVDVICSVYKYNISIKDYFHFRFYELNDIERIAWAGTGFMYEFQLLMNPKGSREVLENKILFLNHFKPFIGRLYSTYDELKNNPDQTMRLLVNPSERIVLKNSHGQIGAEVEVIYCKQYTPKSLLRYMEDHKYDLAEEYVIQHPAIMDLSPSGLNTVRVFTQLNGGRVDILGARLRISVNSPIDNMAAGNLAAPVNIETGMVNGPGVYSDITKEDKETHPITGKIIMNFVIPHWQEVVELAKAAAKKIPENRSVGWDIAVTSVGPELIEGNHNWCKLLWQLPVKRGLKSQLEKYL